MPPRNRSRWVCWATTQQLLYQSLMRCSDFVLRMQHSSQGQSSSFEHPSGQHCRLLWSDACRVLSLSHVGAACAQAVKSSQEPAPAAPPAAVKKAAPASKASTPSKRSSQSAGNISQGAAGKAKAGKGAAADSRKRKKTVIDSDSDVVSSSHCGHVRISGAHVCHNKAAAVRLTMSCYWGDVLQRTFAVHSYSLARPCVQPCAPNSTFTVTSQELALQHQQPCSARCSLQTQQYRGTCAGDC